MLVIVGPFGTMMCGGCRCRDTGEAADVAAPGFAVRWTTDQGRIGTRPGLGQLRLWYWQQSGKGPGGVATAATWSEMRATAATEPPPGCS